MQAVARSAWCSSDPLCIEADASGVDSLNLAACHACLLLPEVVCEERNLLLDRALLVGVPEDPEVGYFGPLLEVEHRWLGCCPRRRRRTRQSAAELRMFRRIRDELSDEWAAIHSLGTHEPPAKPWAEIDFVLVGPDGVYCLEVKGGRIARVDGEWLFTNRKDETTRKHEGPFAQVGSASAALHQRDQAARADRAARQALHTVSSRPMSSSTSRGRTSNPQVVYDARDLEKPFASYMERLVDYWRVRLDSRGRHATAVHRRPRGRRSSHHLRGDFDLRPSLRAQIGLVNEELLRLTVDQYAVLDGLVDNPRVAREGQRRLGQDAARRGRGTPAGGPEADESCCAASTGCSASSCGRRLATNPRSRHARSTPCMAARQRRRLRAQASRRVQGRSVRALLPRACARGPARAAGRVSTPLTVDEAQDVLRPAYLDVLDAALDGGIARGEWRVFLDPKQNMFDGPTIPRLAELLRHSPAQYRLTCQLPEHRGDRDGHGDPALPPSVKRSCEPK